jgi:hypothetical protein
MARKKTAAAAAEPVDVSAVVDRWFADAYQVVNLCQHLERDSKQLPSYFIRLGDCDEFSESQLEKLREDMRKTRKVVAQLLLENSEHLLAQLGNLTQRFNEQPLYRLFEVAYSAIGQDFSHGKYSGGMFAWTVLQPFGYAMRRWARELSAFWENCPEFLNIEWQQQFQNKVDECPFETGIDYAINKRLTLEHGQITRDLVTIHGKQRAATNPPKKTTKETLRAAKPETLQRFIDDAKVMERYQQWLDNANSAHNELRTNRTPLQIFAAKERMAETKMQKLRQRYDTYTHKGWTLKTVQAELDRKLAKDES